MGDTICKLIMSGEGDVVGHFVSLSEGWSVYRKDAWLLSSLLMLLMLMTGWYFFLVWDGCGGFVCGGGL